METTISSVQASVACSLSNNRIDSPCRKKLKFMEPKKSIKIFEASSHGKRKFRENCLDSSNSSLVWKLPSSKKKSKTLIEC